MQNAILNSPVLFFFNEKPFLLIDTGGIDLGKDDFNKDIIVQASIAIDEAKILCKPIVVTNFSTAKDQIINNKNGTFSLTLGGKNE